MLTTLTAGQILKKKKNNNLLSAELANLHIKGPIETACPHCHQTLILAFLPGSDSNPRLRLNLSLGLSCLDMSVRLGQSGECWQDTCHCWHFSKPHLNWKRSANSRSNSKGNFIRRKHLFRDCTTAIYGADRPQTKPTPSTPPTIYHLGFSSPAYVAKSKGEGYVLGLWTREKNLG